MKLICPECKNEVDLTPYHDLADGHIVECNHCGITLMITRVSDGTVEAEIVDEGK